MERVNIFNNIDSKEKAYALGFILGDGHVSDRSYISTTLCLDDRCICNFLLKEIGGEIKINESYIPEKRKFPNITWTLRSKADRDRILTIFGGRLKTDRHFPRINKELEPYLVLGFFDAEGCITWGKRKDRDRIWQKVLFSSQYKILIGLQKILINIGISSSVNKVNKEECYKIEFSNEMDVFKMMQYLPKDCFRLERKKINFEKWLDATLSKYSSFKLSEEVNFVNERTLHKYGICSKYKIKSSEIFKIKNKNNGFVDIFNSKTCIDNVPIMLLSKKGISNYALRLELGELLEGRLNE